jgi:YD repeat-containing protein
VIRETSPDAGVTTYVRDLRGLVTQMTDGRGVVSNMSYDNAGRLLTVAYPAAVAENMTYSYDLATSSRGKLYYGDSAFNYLVKCRKGDVPLCLQPPHLTSVIPLKDGNQLSATGKKF